MRLLTHPFLFDLFNRLIGAGRCRFEVAQLYVRAAEGDRVLDIGCGTADILQYLPAVVYTGFDENPLYIETAQKRYGSRGRFLCRDLRLGGIEEGAPFDIVLALGVLHHLNDAEAVKLIELAAAALKPRGRLVTFDGCYTDPQSFATRFILSRDRGKFVRSPEAYVRLVRRRFPNVKVHARNNLLSIPYPHFIMECGL